MIGKTISHYKIIEKLGEGGMGEVYLAEDFQLKRKVAIKFLPSHLIKDKESRERFEREAQAAAALNHPNIITVYEIGEFEEHVFIVMEYAKGETLRDKIDHFKPTSTEFPIEEIINFAIQICEGLEKAHQAGIIHRDIKPGNIIIDKDNKVKILDFGLAKLKGVSQLTKETSTIGTIHYMSPEQIRGEEVDHRSDIWSLGVILYEMITGRLPFIGEYEQAVMYSILNENPEFTSDVPPDLQTIVQTCLEKDVVKRYPKAEIILDTLKSKEEIEREHSTRKKRSMRIPRFAILTVIVAFIAAYFIVFKRSAENTLSTESVELSWKNSIAVLPFVDMSPEKDQEYFCDGMSEEIINALTHIEKLRVIARTSAFAFKGKNVDVRDIGKKLDVETLLEGSVRKAENRLRVTAQLIRTSDGAHLWSKRYDRNLTDVFAIQDEIALAIVSQLKLNLFGGEEHRIVRHPTVHLEAYNQYLRGRHLLNRRKREDIYTAISYFENAIEFDSLYALGYIGLADAYALLPVYASEPQQTAYPKAKEVLSKALEINDQMGEAHASLGWIKLLADWDWSGAEQAFQRAVSLNPGYATAYHWFGYLYMIMGKFDKSIPIVTRALELDPLSPVINRVIGDVFCNARQYDKAIPALRKTLDLEPCMPFGHSILGLCYQQKSMYNEALEAYSKEKECREDSAKTDYLFGVVYAKMGEMEKARQILGKLKDRDAKGGGMAQLYFALGDNENGFKMLEEMYNDHDTWLIFIHTHPGFDDVRSHPRFRNIIKKIRLDK